MGFKVFTSTTLTAADVNDYLAEQAVIVCTSATRPTAQYGMTIFETDTGAVRVYDGTGWVIMSEPVQSTTPTMTNLSSTSAACHFRRHDGLCDFWGRITLGASAPSGQVGIGLPTNAANTTDSIVSSWCIINDTGTATYHGLLFIGTTARADVYAIDASGTYAKDVATAAAVPHSWASTDTIDFGLTFRMSSRYS